MRWPVVLLCITVLATFSSCILSEFTTWDDDTAIYDNASFAPPTTHSLWVWWTSPTGHLWNPAVSMVQGLLALFPTSTPDPLTGSLLNPYLFHATNIALHLCSTLILYRILRRLRFAAWPACAGALVFAVHPLQVEPVAWASALKDILYGFFSLSAILVYLISAETAQGLGAPRNARLARMLRICATALFLLAVLSKVTAIMLPLVVMSLTLLDPELLPPRRTIRQISFWFLAAAPLAILTNHWQPARADAATALWQRPLIATDTLAFYLYKLVWPMNLLIDYGRDPHKIFERGWAYWTWILPVSVGIALWLARKRARTVLVGALIFTAMLIPVLGFSSFDFQFYSTTADRYVYLSMFGVAIACAWAVERGGRYATVIAILLLAMLSVRSYVQCGYWRNSYVLYLHAEQGNPDSIAALRNAATELLAAQEPDKAIEFSIRGKKLRPHDPLFRLNLASVYARTRRVEQAVEEYRDCFPLDQQKVLDALMTLTAQLGREKRYKEAFLPAKLAIELAPFAAATHLNYGSILAASGDRAGALRELQKALELDPADAAAQSNLVPQRKSSATSE